MNQLSILLVAATILLASCSKDPQACFNAPEEALENEPIQFDNCSVHAESYYWWFDDHDTSNEMNPVKSYAKRGLHLVYLTAYGSKGQKQSKYNRQIRIGNLFVDSIVVRDLEMTDATGSDWDNDGTGPDVRLVYGETGSKATLTSKEHTDFDLSQLPIVVKPQAKVQLTDTMWSFTLLDQDAADADTMTTWQVDPIQYDHEGPYLLENGPYEMELHYFFE